MKIFSLLLLFLSCIACTNQQIHPALDGPVDEWQQIDDHTWHVILEDSPNNRELIQVKHYEGQSNASFVVISACADSKRLLVRTIRLKDHLGIRNECDPDKPQGAFHRQTLGLMLLRAPDAPDQIADIVAIMKDTVPYEAIEVEIAEEE